MAKPTAPKHLSAESKKFFRWVSEEYDITDPGGLRLLQSASEALDRIKQCREQIDVDGVSTLDRFGQRRAHPLLSVERDNRAAFLAAMKSLNLDLEPLNPTPGRPPGR
jgi:phage terminase small subunit